MACEERGECSDLDAFQVQHVAGVVSQDIPRNVVQFDYANSVEFRGPIGV